MTNIILILLALCLTVFGCATPPPLPPQNNLTGEIKELQTKILLELNPESRRSDESLYQKLVGEMSEGVILQNMFGDILESNPAFGNMVGYSVEELKKVSFQKIIPANWYEKDRARIVEAMSKEEISSNQEFVKKNGESFMVDLTLWIIKDKRGNPLGSGCLVKPASK